MISFVDGPLPPLTNAVSRHSFPRRRTVSTCIYLCVKPNDVKVMSSRGYLSLKFLRGGCYKLGVSGLKRCRKPNVKQTVDLPQAQNVCSTIICLWKVHQLHVSTTLPVLVVLQPNSCLNLEHLVWSCTWLKVTQKVPKNATKPNQKTRYVCLLKWPFKVCP